MTLLAPINAIEIRDLVKIYKSSGRKPAQEALHGVNLDIPRGSIFGLLGPNGAGKSTLINILAGLVIKSSGTAKVWSYDINTEPRLAKSSIGVVPQELNLDAFFTPRELLDTQAGMYGVPKAERRTEQLLAAVDLSDKADAYARALSGGMRRRLMVAKAMVHNPPVLVLDEPTAGVDIELRKMLWDYIRALNRAGTTVLLTTHYLEEAQELCDRIAIIHKGQLVANDTKPNLLRIIDNKRLSLVLTQDVDVLPDELLCRGWVLNGVRQISITYRPTTMTVDAVLAAVRDCGLNIADLTTQETDLEDVFLRLTQTTA
jgi:ABC-2 type transport system ATP-binding protein